VLGGAGCAGVKGRDIGPVWCGVAAGFGSVGATGPSAGFGALIGVNLGKKPIRDPFREQLLS
jgi:hypothetical protein